MTVGSFGQRDEHGGIIVIEIAAEGHLDVLDVLPAVDVHQLDLRRVGNTGVKGLVVVVA